MRQSRVLYLSQDIRQVLYFLYTQAKEVLNCYQSCRGFGRRAVDHGVQSL